VTPFFGSILGDGSDSPNLDAEGFDFREHNFKVETLPSTSSMGMPSELDIMVEGLQLTTHPDIPSSILESLTDAKTVPGAVSHEARVYYSVLDKSHGDIAIWFLYIRGFILGVQVFYPKMERLWKYSAEQRTRVGRYQTEGEPRPAQPQPNQFLPLFRHPIPIHGPSYAPPANYPPPANHPPPASYAARVSGPGGVRNPRAPQPAYEPPVPRPKAVLGTDVLIYSQASAMPEGMVPKLIHVKGIPGTTRGETLAYDGGTRFKNGQYLIEAYPSGPKWYWGLYKTGTSTRMARKAADPTLLMASDGGPTTWSFETKAPPIQYEIKPLTITNAGPRSDAVPMRLAAIYLPLQPRRLAARLGHAEPVADAEDRGARLSAIMADLSEIKRALNGASLLSKA
jgi:hypothetical protein